MNMRYCERCKTETEHQETLERKPSSYDQNKSIFGRIMLFVHEFINGGHYYNMNRFVICKQCSTKVLDNKGTEFE